jgi:hypothetical protein
MQAYLECGVRRRFSGEVARAATYIQSCTDAALQKNVARITAMAHDGAMKSSLSIALAMTLLLAGWGNAADFAIELKVQVGKKSLTAGEEKADVGAKAKKRAVLRIKAGDKVQVRWTMTNRDPKAVVKNVLVHFFAVKEDELGQKVQPKLDKGVQAESALIMDFNPKDKAKGELSFTVPNPGPYLVRLETIGAAVGADGQEFFAALELMVEE